MKGKIIKIHPLKSSRTEKSFIRVEFLLDNGEWAKTDLVPSYRNYARWKPFMGIDVFVDNLKLRRKGEVDADSYPTAGTPFETKKTPDGNVTQEKLI